MKVSKQAFLGFLFLCFVATSQAQSQQDRLQWWKDAKFGMFLHWGLYSITAGDWKGHAYKGNEHFMLYERIPVKEYGEIAKQMTLPDFNPDEWVKMAKNAGMKYIVVTTKHHDGFAMYNSPSSDYNIVKMTPYGKDPMVLLAEACKKYDIKLCFYYSLGRDWQDPDVPTNWPVKAGRSNTWDYPDEDKKDFSKYFERKVKPQIKELLTQYGPIGVIWFDTPELINSKQSEELAAIIHQLQPNCIINGRIGNGYGDFRVSEQKIGGDIDTAAWEACVTMSGMWGYNKHDTKWKNPELTIRQLTEIVSKGGNFLLNIGPMGNGAFPAPAIERLDIIGKWMATNGEAIYGVSPWKIAMESIDSSSTPKISIASEPLVDKYENKPKTMADAVNDATSKLIFPEIRFTAKGNVLYVFANSLKESNLTVKSLGSNANIKIEKITMLGSSKSIKWKQSNDFLTVQIPEKDKNAINVYVFKVVLK